MNSLSVNSQNMNYDKFHTNSKIQRKIITSNNFTYRNLISVFNKLNLENNIKILDYGSGVGTVDFYFASKGFNIVGLEVSRKAIDISGKSAEAIGLNKNIHFYNINKKLYSKFDVIICSEVIEHISNDYGLLKKLFGLLKKRGYLILSTPSINAPLFRLNLLKGFDNEVGHLRRYEPIKLSCDLKKIGYRIILVKKTEGILRNALFVFKKFGWIVRFLRGPISDLVTLIDEILVLLFGESNIYILSQKP